MQAIFCRRMLSSTLATTRKSWPTMQASMGTARDYGLAPPVGQVLHDAANGYGGFASLIYNRTPHDQLRLVTQLRAGLLPDSL